MARMAQGLDDCRPVPTPRRGALPLGGGGVCLPFNIACGKCVNCNRGLTNYCIEAQPMENMAGAAYGFADMGPYQRCWSRRR